MDRYSIVDPNSSWPGLNAPPSPPPAVPEVLSFPKPAIAQPMPEMAKRDLTASLQLLVARARHLTGASGAAIALRDTKEMICQASSGSSAPQVGTELQVDSGLTGESVRSGEILRCEDASGDQRVNRESCNQLGIASIIVLPLLRDGAAVGVFELLSDRKRAFEERDVESLRRLGEMVLIALDHASAANRVEGKVPLIEETAAETVPHKRVELKLEPEAQPAEASPPNSSALLPSQKAPLTPQKIEQTDELKSLKDLIALKNSRSMPAASATPKLPLNSPSQLPVTPALAVRKCESCGFPVSEGRPLCLDCEEKRHRSPESKAPEVPLFMSQGAPASWLQEHGYTIATVLVTVVTAGVLFFWFRLH